MVRYLPYNPNSTVRVEEVVTVNNSKAFLRHIPKKSSIVIDGFIEVESLMPQPNQFSCDYALDSLYRDANRVLNFNKAHNGQSLSVNYIAIGTVFTADDANEIKAHMEDASVHGDRNLPTASASVKGAIKVGNNLYMQGDTLNASVQIVNAGNGLAYSGNVLNAILGQGLHFDELGRIAIFLGNGVVYSDVMRGFQANPDGTFSVLVDNSSVHFVDNAISVNTSQGLEVTSEGIQIKKSNGLAFDSDGGLFVHCGRGITYDDLNRICVRNGNGLTFDGQNLIAKLGDGLTFDQNGNIKVSAQIAQSIPLGAGLAIDDDGSLYVQKAKPVSQWEYHDSGYDVIPVAPLIYVDDPPTKFYQPQANATLNDMFNTPEGVMEAWIRCDFYCSDITNNIRNFSFGSVSPSQNNLKCGVIHSISTHVVYTFDFIHNGSYSSTGLSFNRNAKNRILLHMVSHPTDGYIELSCNYGTKRVTGNVNNGKPFEGFFVYSMNNNVLFSNFQVSNTQLPYEE